MIVEENKTMEDRELKGRIFDIQHFSLHDLTQE